MEAVDIARWQFGITTVYHYIFVPLTIGLAPLVAIMQTMWVVKGDEKWLRLTKFFGKLFLINFALGVVTGIVQEFQFGMNWSHYSRFVGDIFGAPLAMEALAAFFIESTFLGLWIFGWDRLSRKIHLATIWLVAFAVNLSAVFILAANSFMRHPVGAELNVENGRAELTDIAAVLFNPTWLTTFPHVITGAFLTAGTFVAGIAGWQMVRHMRMGKETEAKGLYRSGAVFGMIVILISGVGVILTGDMQAKMVFDQQPMKMAAAEGMCEDPAEGEGVPFSLLTVGLLSNDCKDVKPVITIPGVTSFLKSWDFNDDSLKSVTTLAEEYKKDFGEKDGSGKEVNYIPSMAVTYWSFRLMIALAGFSALLAVVGLWVTRKGRVTDSKAFKRVALIALPMPFLAASFGWILTEMGRQPWIVVPNLESPDIRMLTADGVSGVAPWQVLISLVAFTLIYGACAVAWGILMKKYATAGAPEIEYVSDKKPDSDDPLTFAY